MTDARVRVCMVGSANTDVVGRVPRFPREGECLTGASFAIGQGGKGANQAVMAARLGADVAVVARLGNDVFGSAYRDYFTAQGVETRFIVGDPERASGVAMILVEEPTGRNTIAYLPGANAGLSVEDVLAAAPALAATDVVICQLETPMEATIAAFRLAAERAGPPPVRLLNAAPVPVPPQPLPGELLDRTDVLVANEEEVTWLAGRPVTSRDDALEAAAALAARHGCTTIVTLGAGGVAWAEAGASAHHLPVTAVQAVDTTGAGDAFVGALGVLLGGGTPLALAIERAAAVATLSVQRAGAQSSYPTRDEVRSRLGW